MVGQNETPIRNDIVLALSKKYMPHIFIEVRRVGVAEMASGNKVAFSIEGQADITGFIRGIHFEIEVKVPGKKIKDKSQQDKWRTAVKRCGAIHIETTSVEDALQQFDEKLGNWFDRFLVWIKNR